MKTKSTTIHAGFALLALIVTAGLAISGPNPDYDFGDAPDSPYPTLLANDGARHDTADPTGPLLGTARDIELDGQPTISADGDDLTAMPDDEDGVVFGDFLFPGGLSSVTVTTSGTGPYILNAWMDFNSDGDWLDPGEQIFTDTPLAAGVNALSFAVPAGAALGPRTYSRWRLNRTGGLAPTGAANNGEVEDYCVGSVHGRKWWDRNEDGKQDPDEPGLNGWPIHLYDASGTSLIATVVTHDMDLNGDGEINRFTERGIYWINGVPADLYIIREEAHTSAVQSFPFLCGGVLEYFIKVNECQVLGRVPPDQPPVCGNTQDWVDICPPGFDEMFSVAAVQIGTPAGPPFFGQPLDLFANGDTLIERLQPTPGQPATFQTEMIAMDLTGSHPQLGPIHVRAGADFGLPPTNGLVTELEPPPPTDPFLVESFFDVFFEIEVPSQGQIFHNQVPAQVEAVPGITQVPPINSEYIEIGPIPLLDPGNNPSGFTLIQLVHKPIYGLDFGNHTIIIRPDCCIGKKAKIGSHKFNNVYLPNRQQLRCKGKVRRPVMWFITIENDGDVTDVICGKSSRVPKKFRMKCVDKTTGRNVTTALKRGTYTAQLAPGEVRLIKCTAKAKDRRAARLNLRNSFTATSKTDPTKIDQVKLLAKLKR